MRQSDWSECYNHGTIENISFWITYYYDIVYDIFILINICESPLFS